MRTENIVQCLNLIGFAVITTITAVSITSAQPGANIPPETAIDSSRKVQTVPKVSVIDNW